ENLALFARLFGVHDAATRLGEWCERFELGAFIDRPTRTYSRGQLQRVAIARSLLHAPALWLLDEPSTGLDKRSTDRLIETLERERARGAIVALVTHDAELASRVADRRLELRAGRIEEAPRP